MERRHFVAALAAGLAIPAVARAQSPASSDAKPMLSDLETSYIKQTMTAGSASLATSRIALKRAQDTDVMEFAKFEADEQNTIASILKSMTQPATLSGEVTPPSDAEVEASLDAKGKDALMKVRDAKNDAFDRDYVRSQIAGHRELLEIQDNYLKSGRNPQALAVAKLGKGQIKEHLALLSDIENGMGKKG